MVGFRGAAAEHGPQAGGRKVGRRLVIPTALYPYRSAMTAEMKLVTMASAVPQLFIQDTAA